MAKKTANPTGKISVSTETKEFIKYLVSRNLNLNDDPDTIKGMIDKAVSLSSTIEESLIQAFETKETKEDAPAE